MSASFSTTIERERKILRGDGAYDDVCEEITIEVTFSYSRGYRGARDSLCGVRGAGPPLEPDEPAHVEILSVVDKEANEYELTERERESIVLECLEYQACAYEADQEARAEGNQ